MKSIFKYIYCIKMQIYLLLILLPILYCKQLNQRYPKFQDYLQQFNKVYSSQQFNLRKNIYLQNIQVLKAQNNSWKGVTKFTDFTRQQLQNLFKQIQLNQFQGYGLQIDQFSSSNLQTIQNRILLENQQLPPSFDWRDRIPFTPVKDQAPCQSCWAFTTVAFFQQQAIVNKQANQSIDLSQQFLLSCDHSNSGCIFQGHITTATKFILQNKGIPYQSKYPFSYNSHQPNDICITNDLFKIEGYKMIKYHGSQNQKLLRKYLLEKPINIGIAAQSLSSYNPQNQQSRTLFCDPKFTVINHGVLLVGYTQTQWIIKNSWNQYWGINGYGYISRSPQHDCSIGKYFITTISLNQSKNITQNSFCLDQYRCIQCSDINTNNQSSSSLSPVLQNKTLTCKPCQVQNCQKCQQLSIIKCFACKEGFILNIQFLCQLTTLQGCRSLSKLNDCKNCKQGYILTSNFTCQKICGIINCDQCRQNKCISCQKGYALIELNAYPEKCVKNTCSNLDENSFCQFCNQDGKCISCQLQKFYKKTCTLDCEDPHCVLCSNLKKCTKCQPGYSLTNLYSDAFVCQKFEIVLDNCQLNMLNGLENHIKCLKCDQYYYFDWKSQSCLPYKNQNCSDLCDLCYPSSMNNSVCKCKQNYTFDSTTSKCILFPTNIDIDIDIVSACSVVSKTKNQQYYCSNCSTGFLISKNKNNNSCEKLCCVSNCLECQARGREKCWICEQKYYKDQFLQCKLCFDKNCLYCMENKQCLKCEVGFQVSQNKLNCLEVICGEKSFFNQTQCSCIEGYYKSQSNVCVQCETSNCLICSKEQKCKQCIQGYYFEINNRICAPCIQNCNKCTLNSSCNVCDQGYFLNSEKKCSQYLYQSETYHFQQKSNQMHLSTVGCQIPFPYPDLSCQKCADGFSSWYYFCYPCEQNCKRCFANAKGCIQCYSGFSLQKSKCIPCKSQFCLKCSASSQICTSCVKGYFLLNKSCMKCPQNCFSCQINTGICQQCINNYVLSNEDKSCIKCAIDSKKCDHNQIYVSVLKCESNQFINSANQCQICKQNCLRCSSFDQCSYCSKGYSLQQKKCIKNCGFGCFKCSQTNSSTCLTCFAGYKLVQSSPDCQPDLSCNDKQTCFICPQGYFPDGSKVGKCLKCKMQDQNCLHCFENNSTRCVKCKAGFYVNNFQCQKCIQNCSKCSKKYVCSQCSEGYFFVGSQRQVAGRCLLCDLNCKTCDTISSKCLSCFEGFELSLSNYCLRTQKIRIEIVLDIELGDFVNKFKVITQGLLNLIGSTSKNISRYLTFKSVKSGSVIINAEISIPEKQNGSEMFLRIQQNLKKSSKIGQIPMLSSNFILLSSNSQSQKENHGSQQNVDSLIQNSNNFTRALIIIIILASVIGIGIVLFYTLKWKKYKQHHHEENEKQDGNKGEYHEQKKEQIYQQKVQSAFQEANGNYQKYKQNGQWKSNIQNIRKEQNMVSDQKINNRPDMNAAKQQFEKRRIQKDLNQIIQSQNILALENQDLDDKSMDDKNDTIKLNQQNQ